MRTTFVGAWVQLRVRGNDTHPLNDPTGWNSPGLYMLYVRDEKRVVLERWDNAAKQHSSLLGEFPLSETLKTGQDYDLELRAVVSLAQLRLNDGERATASAVLRPLYESFGEGFDTPDLIEARQLIEALR